MPILHADSHWVLIFSFVIIMIVLIATLFSFWRKRYIDDGPKKGEAENPLKVKEQNPPDRN